MQKAPDYFVIHGNEDGEPTIERLTKLQLELRLNDNYYGSPKIYPELQARDLINLDGLIIIKGETVMPRAAVKVEKWEV